MSTPGKNPTSPDLDSDDDDLPLLAQVRRPAAMTATPQRNQTRTPEEDEDTSDDDKPLIAKIAKPKATPKKKTRTPTPKARAKNAASPRVKRCKAEPSPSPKAARKRSAPNGDGGSQSDLDDEEQVSVFKEGQIKVCPPLGDAQRAFYESLLAENARSIIAIKYCVEQGVLIGTQAKAGYAQYKILKEAGAFRLLGGVKPEMIAQLD